MKSKISRLTGIIIAMLIVCCPINLLAATEGTLENESQSVTQDGNGNDTNVSNPEDFTYEVISEDNKSCRITKYTGNDEAVYIPSVIDGYSVVEIGSAFNGCNSLSSITIPESVTSIGITAFCGCSSLSSVTIPESVTSIESSAFAGCSSLSSITIPESVTRIENWAFSGCSSLSSITILGSATRINGWAFSECSSLSSIAIPEGTTSIVNYAFSRCSGLRSITIPESVTSIGDGAFSGCSRLSSITIPESVTSIGGSAFSECTGLAKICNESAMEIDLSSIDSRVLWYDLESGEAITKLGTGTAVNTKIANNEAGIPDVNFYNAVLSSYDADKNGVLTTDEVENVTSLTLTYKKIESIQGIQHFTSLKELNLSSNQITDISLLKGMVLDSLNLSKN